MRAVTPTRPWRKYVSSTTSGVDCPNPACLRPVGSGLRQGSRFLTCDACLYRFRKDSRILEKHLPLPKDSEAGLRFVLCDIRSIHNVGSIFRTAAAFGARELVLCGVTGGPPRPDLAKVSLGSERMVPWRYHAEALPVLESLQQAGHRIWPLDTGPDTSLLPPAAGLPGVLVLGGERGGIPEMIRRRFGPCFRIPHSGPKNSLNVSVAAGIAAYWSAGSGGS